MSGGFGSPVVSDVSGSPGRSGGSCGPDGSCALSSTVCLRGGVQKKCVNKVNQWSQVVPMVEVNGDPRGADFFCLLDYFYGQKRPQNAINRVYPAISTPGGSKLVVLRGSRLDLSRKHPGRCVGTIFGI